MEENIRMGMEENNRMGMEEEEIAFELEGEEDIMDSEEEEEEEEVEQLDEQIRLPWLTTWMGPDGVTVHGIVCIDDGLIRLKIRCRLDDCPICLQPCTNHGKHQLCCLPCGHIYGFSCIKKWLSSSSSGKCPQCNTECSFQDAILVYPPHLCNVASHQNASFFPLTKSGFLQFKDYEFNRMDDAESLLADDTAYINMLESIRDDLADRANQLRRLTDYLSTRAEELEQRHESLGQADALRTRASLLIPRAEALERRAAALERRAAPFRRRVDALTQRSDAYESRMRYFLDMIREHHKPKQGLETKKELTEKAAAKPEKKHEKAAEEEKVEVKAGPTTMTTERVRVRSRSNGEKGPVVHIRQKSNNYMYYYAAGVAAVLTSVPLAVGYTLYA